EARNPASRLMIVDTPAAVTITNELGQSRLLHPDGRQESFEYQGVPLLVTSKRDGDRLIVVYYVEQNRELHYLYSHTDNPSQLVVELQSFEHGSAGDKAKRLYDAGVASDTTTTATTTTPTKSGAAPPAGGATPPARENFDERPGAELKGLKSLGILVEDL